MPRSLRYLMIWLCCTALTVTAAFLAVRFVVHSTAALPPTAHALPTVFTTPTPTPGLIGPATSAPNASPSPTTPPAPSPRATTARPTTPVPAAVQGAGYTCRGGAGVHTMQSMGGQVTFNMGADAICLVSAVPAPGFTTSTAQSAPDTLTVTFSSANHRSETTGTIHPQPQAVTREVSW
ncbi:hypothetical protein QMK19_26655 [Streptomyces sp. H10-C2]|uniref:hypothetical protein n=1 Tax=unclassified Streptomyces TaxID=2593676 RepID=UPI0024B99C33|nr:MULTISPECIES: hypothetical protein [unclassified Streptomyces]MDJ0343609.1 hypothetical protein [Streptomyces sp. PH10-H1]MDJ0373143.1 hypothetical protein [Streptomyces sp. H10-C2]